MSYTRISTRRENRKIKSPKIISELHAESEKELHYPMEPIKNVFHVSILTRDSQNDFGPGTDQDGWMGMATLLFSAFSHCIFYPHSNPKTALAQWLS